MEQKKKYKAAIEKFVDLVKDDNEIIGILVCGSYVHSKLDKNSDVDIHLILDKNCNYRERGNVWIDDVEIEYFKNPPQQIRSYFKQEKTSPHTADMFVNSIVIVEKSIEIKNLIEDARKVLDEKPDTLNRDQIEISKYHLDDIWKDLEDCLAKKDEMGFHFVKNKLVDECIFLILSLNQTRRTKEKRLSQQLEKIDREFAELISKSIAESIFETKDTKSLIAYTENLLGGKRSKEWKLRSGLDL